MNQNGLGIMPPHNIEAEEAILGALLVDREASETCFGILPLADVFYKEENRIVFTAIRSLYDRNAKIDLVTVSEECKIMGELQRIGGSKAIVRLTSKISSAAHLEPHCRIVLEMWMKRELAQAGHTVVKDCYSDERDIFDIVNGLEETVSKTLNLAVSGEPLNMKQVQKMEELQEEKQRLTGYAGIPSGFHMIDEVTGGYMPGTVTIVAARPGMGKTAFVLNVARNCGIRKTKTAIFSLEMPALELNRRLTSTHSGVFSDKLKKGNLNEYDQKAKQAAKIEIASWPLFIDDTAGLSLRKLRAKSAKLVRKYGIELIILDYLQLMKPEGKKNQNREGEISEISRGLKEIAKEFNVPLIVLSQLSREPEKRADKTPLLSDLRESGAIEQDADDVQFLFRPVYYGFTEEYNVGGISCPVDDLAIWMRAKARDGELKDVPLHFFGPCVRFTDWFPAVQKSISSQNRIEQFEDAF